MKKNGKKSVSVIGGEDGPTSIFIAGRMGKQPLKYRVSNYLYKCKCKRMENKIHAGGHTLKEVFTYANERFTITEVQVEERNYIEQRKSLKENLILKYKTELLDGIEDVKKPNEWNEDSIREFQRQLEIRSERIAEIPDNQMPMDFHVYEINIENGRLEMEIDYIWNVFGVSYSGNKKVMKRLRKISHELYLYYGVTEEDINNKSERYRSLIITLCS